MKYQTLWIPSAIPFFMFGFVYYLISPAVVLNIFPENRIFSAALEYIDLEYFGVEYFVDAFLMALSFLTGYLFLEKGKFKDRAIIDFPANFKLSPALLFAIFLMLLVLFVHRALSAGTVFFSGYSQYDISVLGPFATLIFLSALFHNYFHGFFSKLAFFSIFIVSSVLMLSLGSRMFFVLGTITVTVGWLSRNKSAFKNPLFYLCALAFLCLVISVGIWRSGGNITFETFITIFFAEPVLTATSGAVYITNLGGRPVIGIPSDIVASVVNFVPSIIYPDKITLIEDLTYDENKFSPFGASSILVNVYSNFGMLYPLYFFGIGAFLGILRRRANGSEFYRAVYFSILPLLMLHFFREGFITVFKVIFFNGFILPLFIVVLMFIFFGVSRKQVERK